MALPPGMMLPPGFPFAALPPGKELERAKAALTPGPAAAPTSPPASPSARLPPPYGLAAHLTREGTPEQREGARRAAATGRAAAAAPGDAAAALAHGLALQHLAAALGPARLEDQRALLLAACEVYDGAGGATTAFNYGVALHDLAHAAGAPPAEAAASLAAAARQYAASLESGPTANAAQALNNWALVLQELAGSAAPAERGALRRRAVARFRAAMRAAAAEPRLAARFAYNLGTAL
jgi:hypothetical protein